MRGRLCVLKNQTQFSYAFNVFSEHSTVFGLCYDGGTIPGYGSCHNQEMCPPRPHIWGRPPPCKRLHLLSEYLHKLLDASL